MGYRFLTRNPAWFGLFERLCGELQLAEPPFGRKSHEIHPLTWDADGQPISVLFDDPFCSRSDGPGETRHVFLKGNRLPEAWATAPYFSIAELGFGTGLNFLETWSRWRATRPFAAQLSFTSFEAYPLSPDQITRALKRWPHLSELSERMLSVLPSDWPPHGEERPIRLDRQTQLMIVIGDARETVAGWPGRANAWYLDGFSPAKNPEMWNEALMQAVHDKTVPGGTFATYTAAGFVRRNLQAAGFRVQTIDGFGTKRDMLTGERKKPQR
ncbi:hypothetical protein CSC94_05445 [Zhengella mangrovi]|uniref:MnmC-like methyltransferase domain-containing protein n=1 Tax=Zhengella mangrovi TaxID=1982044 RepID=A0A2G1QRM2_9HYPH|nr:hypothetical protein CSC94_05445 [Zhengella mangrovi]